MEVSESLVDQTISKSGQNAQASLDLINQGLFEGREDSSPSKKVCGGPDNNPAEKLEFQVPSNVPSNVSSFQDSLEASTKDTVPGEPLGQALFDSLEMRCDLKYEKAISVEVSVKEVPKVIDVIEYGEAKNYLKTLGGYFLKAISPKMPPGRSFGDKDCLISLKVWNALFIPEERKRINLKTKKVKVFIQEIEFLNEKITPRDWMMHFIKFMLTLDINEFEKKGHIKEPKRILIYKQLTVLLKATAQLFHQICNDLRTLNINITWFKITEIYKAKCAFSFKTDFYLGDKKLVEPLRTGMSNRQNFMGFEEGRDAKKSSKGDSSATKDEEKGRNKSQNLTTKKSIPFTLDQPPIGLSGNLEGSYLETRRINSATLRRKDLSKGFILFNREPDVPYEDPESIHEPLSSKQLAEVFTRFLILPTIVTDARRLDFLRTSKYENAIPIKIEE